MLTARKFIKELRGGSRPILVLGSDGAEYVVKHARNPQGRNVAFNESVGNELYKLCGLPIAEWTRIWVSEDFLGEFPQCWPAAGAEEAKVGAGFCFGSKSLVRADRPIFEILSGGMIGRISNREEFWTAWLVDALCGHTDVRQALFLQGEDRRLTAYFIDHGHLLGGPNGTDWRNEAACRYLDPRVYTDLERWDGDAVLERLNALETERLWSAAKALPEDWVTPTALERLEQLAQRVSNRSEMRKLLSFIEDWGRSREGLHVQRRTGSIGTGQSAVLLAQK